MTISEIHELNRGECLDLLGRSSLGRLAFVDSVGILPIIVPVNYVMHDGSVVFRAGPGAKLAAAVRGAAVAFEVGRTEDAEQTGWNVLVRGIAEELVDATVLTELRDQHLRPWAPGTKRHYVRIDAHLVTGRRIDRNDVASATWDPTM